MTAHEFALSDLPVRLLDRHRRPTRAELSQVIIHWAQAFSNPSVKRGSLHLSVHLAGHCELSRRSEHRYVGRRWRFD